MIDLDSLFPKAEGRPPNGNEIIPELASTRFLSWRNNPKEGDTLRPLGSVPVGITKTGIDLEGRKFYSDPNGIKLFFSYPPHLRFVGTISSREIDLVTASRLYSCGPLQGKSGMSCLAEKNP